MNKNTSRFTNCILDAIASNMQFKACQIDADTQHLLALISDANVRIRLEGRFTSRIHFAKSTIKYIRNPLYYDSLACVEIVDPAPTPRRIWSEEKRLREIERDTERLSLALIHYPNTNEISRTILRECLKAQFKNAFTVDGSCVCVEIVTSTETSCFELFSLNDYDKFESAVLNVTDGNTEIFVSAH